MLYNAIFSRCSTRKYLPCDLSPLWTRLTAEFAQATPLVPDLPVRLALYTEKEVRNPLFSKNVNYFTVIADKGAFAEENAGFMLEQLVLLLTSEGYGTCYLGMAKPVGEETGLLVAFGQPQKPLAPIDAGDLKRKEISQFLEGPYFSDLMEPVRRAPSAMNSQPWYFVDNNGSLYIYRKKPGGPAAPILNRLNRYDMGIALCHLLLSAEHLGKPMQLQLGFEPNTHMPQYIPVAKAIF